MTRTTLVILALAASACADLTAPTSGGGSEETTAAANPVPVQPPSPVPPRPPAQPDPMAALTKIRASHVLIGYAGAQRTRATRSKDEAKKLADQLLGRLRGGAKFDAVANELSDDPSAKGRGGDLGTFDRFTMTKNFAEAAFALKVGEMSAVVETEFGFHIIKRTE